MASPSRVFDRNLQRVTTRSEAGHPKPEDAGFRRASLDGCEYMAVHLGSALPALAACGFGLSRPEVNRALADAADAHPDLVAGTGVRIYFTDAQRRKHAVVLKWARVQALGSTPRRGDPRSL